MNDQSTAGALDPGSAADDYPTIPRLGSGRPPNVPGAKRSTKTSSLNCQSHARDERSSIAQVHLIVKSGELVDLLDRCAALSKLDQTFEIQLACYSGAKENKEVRDLVVACILEAVNCITGNVNKVSGLSHDQSSIGGNSKPSPEKIERLAKALVVMRTRPVRTWRKLALKEAEVTFANCSGSQVAIARFWTGGSLVRSSIDLRLRSGITHRSARFWTWRGSMAREVPMLLLGSTLNHVEVVPSLLFARGTSFRHSRALIGRYAFTEASRAFFNPSCPPIAPRSGRGVPLGPPTVYNLPAADGGTESGL